jgi:putative hydrolase of the HAD superfamily
MNALLLDVGGVIFRSGSEMLEVLGAREPAARAVTARRGPLGPEPDPDWAAMLREEITEREYWARRCAEVGGALGRDWSMHEFMHALYDLSGEELIRPGAAALIADARADGVPVGVLTNDLKAFHGAAMASHSVFEQVDVLVDASVTGILKPDPRAYALAIAKLGVPPQDIVFVDDMPWNAAGARRAGLRAIQLDLLDPDLAFLTARAALGLKMAA